MIKDKLLFFLGLTVLVLSAQDKSYGDNHNIKEILEELHYDSIYHENLYYFSIKTLQQFLNKYGLYVFDVILR